MNTFASGGKVLVCGNGGSAADAQHFSSELVGRFEKPDRPALPVIALTTDTSMLTAWSNDVGFDKVFARQGQAYGIPGDLLIGISTSGNSRNVVEAFKVARRRGIETFALLGKDGGEVLHVSDLALVAPGTSVARIQEMHALLIHILCQLIESQIEPRSQVNRLDVDVELLKQQTRRSSQQELYQTFDEKGD